MITHKDYAFHPLAERYPLMAESELTALAERIRQNGYRDLKPILVWQGKIIDGRNRYQACRRAGVQPLIHDVTSHYRTEEEVKRLVDDLNYFRRHLTSDQRQAIIAELRAAGKTIQEIAKEVGAANSTVHRNLSKIRKDHANGTVKPEAKEEAVVAPSKSKESEAIPPPPKTKPPEVEVPPALPERVNSKDHRSMPETYTKSTSKVKLTGQSKILKELQTILSRSIKLVDKLPEDRVRDELRGCVVRATRTVGAMQKSVA